MISRSISCSSRNYLLPSARPFNSHSTGPSPALAPIHKPVNMNRRGKDGVNAAAKRITTTNAEASGSSQKGHYKPRTFTGTPNGKWSTRRGPTVRVDENATQILRVRDQVKARVERAIQSTFGRKYRVQYFGSTRYGVSHSNSDLDLVVVDPDYPQGFVKTEFREPIYKPRKLAACIIHSGFSQVVCRPSSAVPIVKFRDRVSGLECDLNVNERLGIFNSDMIKQYCDFSPVLRPMLFGIKEWAKPLHLNSPSGVKSVPASFSSYALALMTIGFLQAEGLLPNLQANLPPLSPEDKSAVWTRKPRRSWDVRFRTDETPIPLGQADVNTLLLKWFRFWETFPYAHKCISIRVGAILDRNAPEVSEPSRNPPAPICVMDPFIGTKVLILPFDPSAKLSLSPQNVTVAISNKVLERFKEECAKVVERNANGEQLPQHRTSCGAQDISNSLALLPSHNLSN
ncbi:hypothetical protein BDZ97DRAFT_1445656 [Flammula alnicola]|nr:hypothetical protein BDZ97DRAFT_1445656 [Flammula alnicola]